LQSVHCHKRSVLLVGDDFTNFFYFFPLLVTCQQIFF
jgi:hypothetical protein